MPAGIPLKEFSNEILDFSNVESTSETEIPSYFLFVHLSLCSVLALSKQIRIRNKHIHKIETVAAIFAKFSPEYFSKPKQAVYNLFPWNSKFIEYQARSN